MYVSDFMWLDMCIKLINYRLKKLANLNVQVCVCVCRQLFTRAATFSKMSWSAIDREIWLDFLIIILICKHLKYLQYLLFLIMFNFSLFQVKWQHIKIEQFVLLKPFNQSYKFCASEIFIKQKNTWKKGDKLSAKTRFN